MWWVWKMLGQAGLDVSGPNMLQMLQMLHMLKLWRNLLLV